MNTTFRSYEPGRPTYASRRTNEEWESWRVLITSWHNEGLSRQQMCSMLFGQGFSVNHGQLVRKMTEWNLLARNRSDPSPQPSTSSSSDGANRPSTTIPEHAGTDSYDNGFTASCRRGLTPTISEDTPYSSRTQPLPENPNHKPYAAVKESNTSSFRIAAGVSSNLDGAEARARILQKMEAAESGFPELECCCGDFFKPDKGFTRWKPLYQMLMDETEPVQSLHYVRALARLCCGSELSEAMKSKLEITLQYYTELLQRPTIRNDAAYAIALQLASIQDGIKHSEDDAGLKVTMEFFENQDAYQTVSKNLRDKYSHLYHIQNLSILDLRPSEDPSDWIDSRDGHRQFIDMQLMDGHYVEDIHLTIRDYRDIILNWHNLLDISQYASTLKPWSFHEGHTHARAHFERINTIKLARKIAEVLMSNMQRISWPTGWHCSEALAVTVCDAIGLIVAQEFRERGRLCGLPNDDIPTRLVAATSVLDIESLSLLDRRTALLNISRRLLRAIWVCDPKQALFAPQGLHIGPCRAKKCWDLLGQNVKQFDRTTSLIAPTALPPNLEPQASDDVSMFSSSTKSSFQRFRRMSDRLKHRSSTITVGSVRSKWSGHMSADSLTPEKVLGVGPELLGPMLPAEEHMRLDEEAFRSMPSIKV